MSGDRRSPWWYSGDDDQAIPAAPEPEAAVVPEPEAAVDEGPRAESDGTSTAMDWTALVAGAAKMVDWATERVMAPHAEHTDPAEHPECMVCRTVTLIGDPGGLMGAGQPPPADPERSSDRSDDQPPGPAATAAAPPIRWIPIVETID